MKNNLLALAFLFVSIACYGQSSKVNFGFEVNTSMQDAFIENDVFADREEARIGVSTGFFISYRIKPKLALVGGLSFLNRGSQSKMNFDDFIWGNQFDGEIFNPDIDPMDPAISGSIVSKYNDYYLGIPLNVQFAFGESLDKGFYIQGGFAPMFYWLSRDKQVTKIDGDKDVVITKEEKEQIRKTNLNLQLGFGYNFMLNEKFQISVGPSFEFMLFNSAKNPGFERRFYSYGLTTRFMLL